LLFLPVAKKNTAAAYYTIVRVINSQINILPFCPQTAFNNGASTKSEINHIFFRFEKTFSVGFFATVGAFNSFCAITSELNEMVGFGDESREF
jgi:hypothetical protein